MKNCRYIAIFIIMILYSNCSKDEYNIQEYIEVDGNSSPMLGAVRVLKVTHNSAVINWDAAYDNENDKLYYNLYLENQLLKSGINSDHIFTINNLDQNTTYDGYLEAIDYISDPSISRFTFSTKKYFLTYNKLLESSGLVAEGETISTLDGGYIFAGMVRIDGQVRLCATKIDSCGYIQWSTNFEGYATGTLWYDYEIIELKNQGYIFGSSRAVTKINQQGNIEWNYSLPSDVYDKGIYFQTLIETEDNNILVLGRDYGTNSYTTKLSSDGTLISQNYKGVFSAGSLSPLQDGNFAVLDGTYNNYFLAKIDKEGEVITRFDINDGRFNVLQNVIEVSDGSFVVLSNSWDSRNVKSIRVIKISESGTILWDRLYNWSFYGSNGYDIIENNRGQYIVVGDNEFSYSREALLVTLDQNGNVINKKTFSPDHMDYVWLFKFITQTKDGGYFLQGTKTAVWNYNNKEIGTWILKTDDKFSFEE